MNILNIYFKRKIRREGGKLGMLLVLRWLTCTPVVGVVRQLHSHALQEVGSRSCQSCLGAVGFQDVGNQIQVHIHWSHDRFACTRIFLV